MSQLLITDLEDTMLSDLEKRAADNGRTPTEEAKAILTDVLAPPRKPFSWARVNAIFEEIARGGIQPDIVELLREDRER